MKKNEGMMCMKCRRTAKPAKLSFQGYEISGWRCTCGEEYYNPIQAERILQLNKLKKEALEAKLGRIKSNLILRIPKAIEEALELREGEKIAVRVHSRHKIELDV